MEPISRRKFIAGTAAATGAVVISPYLSACSQIRSDMKTGYFEKEFGISDEICSKLLKTALSHGGDFADLYFEHTLVSTLSLEDGKVNRSSGNIKLGVGIRTVKGDQVGYGFTQTLTEESMLSAAKTAASLVNEVASPVAGKFTRPDLANYYPIDPAIKEFPVAEKVPIMQSLNDACFSSSEYVTKTTVSFMDEFKRIMVVTSEGVKAEDLLPVNYLSASVIGNKNGRMERAGWNLGGRRDFSFYDENTVKEITGKVSDNLMKMFEATSSPAGEMPVVLGPGVSGILLHEAIGHGMEADFNRKDVSIYSNMIGKKVAEPFVNIIDDGTLDNYSGALNVDDEGTPGQKTLLVENGILVSYMHDRISARHYGLEPTGNGRRESFEHLPYPRMRNTYMLGGNSSPEDIIKNIKRGAYVSIVGNGQVYVGQGDFSFYVPQGYMIEDGKLTAPIKDFNIMGNGPKMLENITMAADDMLMAKGGTGYCGKEGQRVKVGFGLPTCLVKSMTVGGTKKSGGVS